MAGNRKGRKPNNRFHQMAQDARDVAEGRANVRIVPDSHTSTPRMAAPTRYPEQPRWGGGSAVGAAKRGLGFRIPIIVGAAGLVGGGAYMHTRHKRRGEN